MKIHINAPETEPRRKRAGGSFKRRLNSLLREIKFLYTSFLRRNTSAGTFVYLERWGKKHDLSRGAGESMREYLFRLSPEGIFYSLSLDLDSIFFGGKQQSLSKPDCRKLRREFHQRK